VGPGGPPEPLFHPDSLELTPAHYGEAPRRFLVHPRTLAQAIRRPITELR